MGTETTEGTSEDVSITTPTTTPATEPVSQDSPQAGVPLSREDPASPAAEGNQTSAPEKASASTAAAAKDTPVPQRVPATVPGPGSTVPAGGMGKKEGGETAPPVPHPHSFHGPGNRARSGSAVPPLTLNHVAIVAASQNKLPIDKVKAIVTRMGRHTRSSAGKLGRWYKNDNYVDNASYSWRNMELFADYQKQMYTPWGTVKSSCLHNVYGNIKQPFDKKHE